MPEDVLQYNKANEVLNKNWTTSSGVDISFCNIIKTISKSNCEIYVGADSNPSRIPMILAVSVAIIKKGEFAKFYYVRSKPWNDTKPALQQRLQDEVAVACCVADEIRKALPNREIVVHADINPDISTASGKYAKQLKSYITGFGFAATIKPTSWAASSIADKFAG